MINAGDHITQSLQQSDLGRSQDLGRGQNGLDYSGIASSRSAPAEDVIEALQRLNSALGEAAMKGWDVILSLDAAAPNSTGKSAIHPIVNATISRQV